LDRLRETLGYKATLKRGYAVVRGDGAVVTTSAAAGKATALEIEFADGRFALGDKAKAPEKSDAAPKPKRKPPEQGSLF
jgi:exodeoxyribonuclease VII large subunit